MRASARLKLPALIGLGGLIGAVGCGGSSATAPSGPCASDEQTASLLYGPPLGVSTHGDTTQYTWGGSSLLFIVQGTGCVEESGGGTQASRTSAIDVPKASPRTDAAQEAW